jgi:biotin-(acetyl-CoA carboxylase) ligase
MGPVHPDNPWWLSIPPKSFGGVWSCGPETVQYLSNQTASTHGWALHAVENGHILPDVCTWVWVRAHSQSAGVGQFNRVFVSPIGGLYVTLICRWPQPVITPLTGVGVMMALHNQLANELCKTAMGDSKCQEAGPLRLKWPNDLYAGERKLAGVLVQGARSPKGALQAVISFGLNVNTREAALPPGCTTVKALTGRSMDLWTLFNALARQIRVAMVQVVNTPHLVAEQASALFALWQNSVTAQTPHGRVEGIFQGLTPEGQVLIDGRPHWVCQLSGA